MKLLWPLALCLLVSCAKGSTPGETPDMRGRSICPDNPQLCPGTCCNGTCVDTTIDARNCGACDTQCPSGTVCANGHCGCLPTGTPCGTGQSCCGTNGCKSLMSDVKNCGACGKLCGTGATCEGGACRCGTQTCMGSDVCCNGACAATCAGTPDMAMGSCVCSTGCPLSGICVGPNCCFEDVLFGGACLPDPSCASAGP
jgi:hypothetical protein